ncbi:MAG TPA: hypothetical protein VE087_02850, partial [Xanthobacteraceae bacterium]|nr:hypothetical protein [Xanthobacteraceae bacterium]
MKLARRAVLMGTAATALALSVSFAGPALADAKRQVLVDDSLAAARKVLSGKDFPDAVRLM